MSCQDTQDLCLLQGASKTYLLEVVDDIGAVVDLTGATITFTMKQNIGGVTILTKTSAVITEIEILDQVTNTGQAKIFLQPSDTSALSTAAVYTYDIWVDLASGNSYAVVPPSCFLLMPSVRF